jgi:hypothetical protein
VSEGFSLDAVVGVQAQVNEHMEPLRVSPPQSVSGSPKALPAQRAPSSPRRRARVRLRTRPLPAPHDPQPAQETWRVTCQGCSLEATAPEHLRHVLLHIGRHHADTSRHGSPLLDAAFVVPHGRGSPHISRLNLRIQVHAL